MILMIWDRNEPAITKGKSLVIQSGMKLDPMVDESSAHNFVTKTSSMTNSNRLRLNSQSVAAREFAWPRD